VTATTPRVFRTRSARGTLQSEHRSPLDGPIRAEPATESPRGHFPASRPTAEPRRPSIGKTSSSASGHAVGGQVLSPLAGRLRSSLAEPKAAQATWRTPATQAARSSARRRPPDANIPEPSRRADPNRFASTRTAWPACSGARGSSQRTRSGRSWRRSTRHRPAGYFGTRGRHVASTSGRRESERSELGGLPRRRGRRPSTTRGAQTAGPVFVGPTASATRRTICRSSRNSARRRLRAGAA
jgi:hypothetical protein